MDDPRQIADDLSPEERSTLLSLCGESDTATLLAEVAARLQERGLAVMHPDGVVDLSDLGHAVIARLTKHAES